jgi:hypothetical protein
VRQRNRLRQIRTAAGHVRHLTYRQQTAQAVWSDGHWCAVRQSGAAGRDAAVAGRRQNADDAVRQRNRLRQIRTAAGHVRHLTYRQQTGARVEQLRQQAINLVAHSWLAPRLQPGDEIVVSEAEHHANLVPWDPDSRRSR